MSARRYCLLALVLPLCSQAQITTPYEQSGLRETATYAQGLAFYRKLATQDHHIQIHEYGLTDSGEPLHLVLYSAAGDFQPTVNRAQGRSILLINNAIHPGEPDGVDASMLLLRDIAANAKLKRETQNLLLAIIPFYNIGGVLNRNSTSRVNQNGPPSHGFRGNAKNYDLNRDFIKSDSRNSCSFAEIFHALDPDILIDTHVSNGADYPYVMTMDYPQKDKLGGVLGQYLDKELMPDLYRKMKHADFEMIPYVNAWGSTPDQGWVQFMDWPRYSSGYAALFHTIGFMSETHMLKPYSQRVAATYAFIQAVIEHLHKNGKHLQQLRNASKTAVKTQKQFALSWQPDKSNPSKLVFKGYTAEQKPSAISGQTRLYYRRDKPFRKTVPYYDNYQTDIVINKPKAYVFSQAWYTIAELLRLNGVKVAQLTEDQNLVVGVYTIEDYKTAEQPYEGHYPHRDVQLSTRQQKIAFKHGDYIVNVDQTQNRYIIETLEPQAPDSFFNWNFFDTHLQQKEHYSAYVFEDLAVQLLKEDSILKTLFEHKKKTDPAFAKDGEAQLDFLYRHSPYHEPEYNRYPVFRLLDG